MRVPTKINLKINSGAAVARQGFVSSVKDYLEVCKPKVVATMLFTMLAGMFLASPGHVPWVIVVAGVSGVALVSAAAAALNQVADHHIDAVMERTRARPLPSGHLTKRQVLIFAFVVGGLGAFVLTLWVNLLTTVLALLSLVGYAVVYTRFLKYATPQNIVIGGAAGATPPLLGWTAVTGRVEAEALLLFLIIFVWTPPHFWALALYRKEDYADAEVPMLPVTHGEDFTRLHILLYTVLLTVVTMLPYVVGTSGPVYLFGAALLDGVFLYYALGLKITRDERWAKDTFVYSIIYILLLFALLLFDAHLPAIAKALS